MLEILKFNQRKQKFVSHYCHSDRILCWQKFNFLFHKRI